MWKVIALAFLVLITASAETKIQYTEDLQKFKKDNHKQRLQLLVGCWLMTRQYHPEASEGEMLALVKVCLRHISRKDSVLKITSLIGKNMSSTKNYTQIVPPEHLPQKGITSPTDDPFNSHLLSMLKNYQKDLSAVQASEGKEIKRRIDEQVQKRQKYYLGFIPANQFSQMMIMISVSIVMIASCTCWKYYHMRKAETEAKLQQRHQNYFNKKGNNKFTKNNLAPAAEKLLKKKQL